MKNKINNENIDKNKVNEVLNISNKILKVLYIFIIIIGVYLLLMILKETKLINTITSILKVSIPLFIGIVIAWLLNPFVSFLSKKGIKRIWGTVISYVILLSIISLLLGSLIPLLYNQITDFIESIPSVFNSIKIWINQFFDQFGKIDQLNIDTAKEGLFNSINNFGNGLTNTLPQTIISLTGSLISGIGVFLIGLVIGFYFLLSFDNIGHNITKLLPSNIKKPTLEIGTEINKSLRNYVNGAIIDSLVVFLASSISFAIIGIKAPLLFGFFCGLMNVIPYAGPYIGGAPAVIVAFSQGLPLGIATLIAIVIIQTIEGNILQTLIMSKTTKLHPITIIVGLLIFGYFFGIVGMLLSTPIIGIIKILYQYFLKISGEHNEEK